jgi:hypothetical protein
MIADPLIAPLVDGVIVFTLLECLALATYFLSTGRGVALRDLLANMVAGLCLMFALRCLAREAGALWVLLFLFAAGIAHASDLWMRWRRSSVALGGARRVQA